MRHRRMAMAMVPLVGVVDAEVVLQSRAERAERMCGVAVALE